MPNTWAESLLDIPDLYGFAAVKELCASRDWPPSVNQIREMALCLANGDVVPPSPWEAWERVLSGASFAPGSEESVNHYRSLSEMERRTVNLIGGAYEIRHTENQGVTRSNFVKAYGELVERDRRRRLALPSVKALASSNRQKPEVTPAKRQIKEPSRRPATREEVSEMLRKAGYAGDDTDRISSVLGDSGLMSEGMSNV